MVPTVWHYLAGFDCEVAFQAQARAEGLIVSGAVTVLLGLAVVACGGVAKAGPPYRACGQEIGNPSGMAVFKLRTDKVPYGAGFVNEVVSDQFVEGSISGDSILELVAGCAHGANVTITPPTVRVVAAIRTTDGR